MKDAAYKNVQEMFLRQSKSKTTSVQKIEISPTPNEGTFVNSSPLGFLMFSEGI